MLYMLYIYEYVTRSNYSSQKWLLNHSMKTFGVVELELQILFLLALDGVNGQLHDPAASPSCKRHRYPFDARAGGPHSRSSRFGIQKISWPVGNRTPIPLSSNLAPYVYVWWEGTTVYTYVWCRFLGLFLGTLDVAGFRGRWRFSMR